jgi:hypothetical protein
MARKPHYDPKSNTRLAWLWSNGFGQDKSDAKIIMELMSAFPGTSEQTARRDLNRCYERFHDLNTENEPFAMAQAIEQAYNLYEQAKNLCQMSAAAKILEHIHKMRGINTDKSQAANKTLEATGTPDADIIRERIRALHAKKSIHKAAEEADIDLNALRDASESS